MLFQEKGQALTEYILIVVLVALACLAALGGTTRMLAKVITTLEENLSGDTYTWSWATEQGHAMWTPPERGTYSGDWPTE
jgi:Flp pilus assembly pilin Flp